MSTPPKVVPGESPLRAFVSSVMSPELDWARAATVDALSVNPALHPWAFEYTPLSSDAPDSTYLLKVRDSDFVIWLIGEKTTPPVRNELAEALASDRRIWAIKLPAEERDEMTATLLQQVGSRAKYGSASSADELRELIALTFADEVVRAFRGVANHTRLAHLEQVALASRLRMVVRWRGAGLSKAEAIALADDLPLDEAGSADEEPGLRILVADVGSGKSHFAERALQRSIVHARENARAPIPVFLRARDVAGRRLADGITADLTAGDPSFEGAFVVVDGLDEIAASEASVLVEESRMLVDLWPRTHVLMTSRPIPLVSSLEEVRSLPLLDREAARELVTKVAQRNVSIGEAASWSRPVADAIKRPLFAILLGLDLREEREGAQSVGALLAQLVERALGSERSDEQLRWLRRAAVLTTRSGAPVPVRELPDFSARAVVLNSGLVAADDESLAFSLPIIEQWFAAQALLAGEENLDVVAASEPSLDRWRFAIAISIATGPASFVDSTVDALARATPAFASEVLEDGIVGSRFAQRTATSIGDQEAGRQLRRAFEAWVDGVGPLRERLVPHLASGQLAPLAISTGDGALMTGWRLIDSDQEVLSFPPEMNLLSSPVGGWFVRRAGVWHSNPGWAWEWSLHELRSVLSRLLKQKSLPTCAPGLVDEALWVMAVEAEGAGSLWADPIDVAVLEDLMPMLQGHGSITLKDRTVLADPLLARIEELQAQGMSHIECPWPGPDVDMREGRWIWSPYSRERQLERVEAVYGAAIEAYSFVSAELFPRLRPRMQIAATLPARLVAQLTPSGENRPDQPILDWYLDPLPVSANSTVEIEFGEGEGRPWYEEMADRQQRLLELRPDAAGWISATRTSTVVEVFQGAPLADMVYGWLQSDLKRVGWV